jgi:hypothetical protein
LEAASRIKEIVYLDNDHTSWLTLLSRTDWDSDTVIHFAARQKEVNLLQLLSSGLFSEEWLTLLSSANTKHKTAMHVYFINMSKKIDGSQKAFITAFRSPLNDTEWMDFLISKKILAALKECICSDAVKDYCLQQILHRLPRELVDKMVLSQWRSPEKDNIKR